MSSDLDVPYGATPENWARWAEGLVASRALGLRCRSIGPGEVELVLENSPVALNPNGAVHGGVVAYAADQVMGIAVTTALPAGQVPVTSTLSMEYHLPARLPLVLRSRVARVGRSVAYVDVEVESQDGRLCSRGRASMVPRAADPELGAVGGPHSA